MKLKSARFGVLLVALAGVLATMVPSAQATTYKTITITGNATLSVGFGYPGAPPTHKLPCGYNSLSDVMTEPTAETVAKVLATPQCTTAKAGPKPGTTVVNVRPGGNTANFAFSNVVCVKTSTSVLKLPTMSKTGVDQCRLTATGTVTGFCGLSTGTGTATITNLSGNKTDTNMVFKFTGVGGVLHVTGGNATENIVGDVNATPTAGTGSCAMKAAREFTVTGSVEYKKCTGTTPCV